MGINKVWSVQEAFFDPRLEQGVDRNTDAGDDIENGRKDQQQQLKCSPHH